MFPFLDGIDSRLSIAEATSLPIRSDPLHSKGLLVSTVHRSFLFENQYLLPRVSSGTLEALRAIGASFELRTLALRLFGELPEAHAGNLSQQMAVHMSEANEVIRESEWLRTSTKLGQGERKNGVWSLRTAVDQLHQIVGWLSLVDQWTVAAQMLPSIQMPLRVTTWPDPVSSTLSIFGQQNVEWEFEESGPDHDRDFVCRIRLTGRKTIEGVGKSKKQARAAAALTALEAYAPQTSKEPVRSRSKAASVIHGPQSAGFRRLAFVAEVLDVDRDQLYLVEQALIHSSWIYENQRVADKCGQLDNSRLSWLGSHTVNFDSAVSSATEALTRELSDYAFRTSEAEQLEAASHICGLPSRMFLGQGQKDSVSRQMAADVFQAVHAVKALSDTEKSPFAGAQGPWSEAKHLVAPGTPKGVDEKTDLQEYAQAVGLEVEYDEEFRGDDHNRESKSVVTLRSKGLAKGVRIGGPWRSGKTQAQRAAAGRVLWLIKPVLSAEEYEEVPVDSAQGRLMAFVLRHLHARLPDNPKDIGLWLKKGIFGLRPPVAPHELTRAVDLWEERCRSLECPFLDEDQMEEFIFAALQGIPADSSLDAVVSEEVAELTRLCSNDSAVDIPFEFHINMISGLANLLRIRTRVGEPSLVKSDLEDLALLLRTDIVEQVALVTIQDASRWTSGSSEALNFILREMKKINPNCSFTEHVCVRNNAVAVTIDKHSSDPKFLDSVLIPSLDELLPNLTVEKGSTETVVTFPFLIDDAGPACIERVYMAWRDRLRPIDTKMAEGLHGVKNSLAAAHSLQSKDTSSRRERLEQELSMTQHLDEALRQLTELKWRSRLSTSENNPTCNLSSEVSAFVRDALPRLGEGCQLNSSIPGVPIIVPMSGVELQIVVSNLFKNAYEAIEGNGEITLTVRSVGLKAYLEVGDDGPGFTAAVEATLEGQPSATSKVGGSGLGLSTIRRMVERTGGVLAMERLDSGTLVRVELPNESENAMEQ